MKTTQRNRPAAIMPHVTLPVNANAREIKGMATAALNRGRGYAIATPEEKDVMRPLFDRYPLSVYAIFAYEDYVFVFKGRGLVEVVEMERRGVA